MIVIIVLVLVSELLIYIPACILYCSNLSAQVIYVHEHPWAQVVDFVNI